MYLLNEECLHGTARFACHTKEISTRRQAFKMQGRAAFCDTPLLRNYFSTIGTNQRHINKTLGKAFHMQESIGWIRPQAKLQIGKPGFLQGTAVLIFIGANIGFTVDASCITGASVGIFPFRC